MMRDVVIIGGGLTGLAAANEVDRLGAACTLIEVKPRLGSSIASKVQNGFILDEGVMLTSDAPDAPFLAQFGLNDAVFTARHDEDGAYIAFKRGMGVLIDTLAQPLLSKDTRHSLMMRMAVSTLGRIDTTPNARFAICMENGMVLDAKAIIVTAPARYAERIFHTLKPEISYRLLDYRYDSIARVSLGYPQAAVGSIPDDPPSDYPISYIHAIRHPDRVPDGHVLIQTGIRYEPEKGIAQDVVGELAALMGWSLNPLVEQISIWKEADPLMWLDDQHTETMRVIQHLLPDGIALTGSDYITTGQRPTLQDRITAGQQAAQRVMAWLNKAKS